MSGKKLIVVFGATGAAGGSVAKYLLEDGTFAVRAVTRNAASPAAQALKEKGAEVVEADLNKPDTIPGVLSGAYGVSGLTDWWALFPTIGDPWKTKEAELQQGKALVDAAKAAGVKHFVYFAIPNSPEVPHAQGKYEANEYLKASGVPRTSFFNCSYFENLHKFGFLKKLDDESFSVELPTLPDSWIPSYSVTQSGGWVLQAFKHPEQWIGKDMYAVSEYISPRTATETLRRVTGKSIKFEPLSVDAFEAMGKSDNPYVRELYLNFKFFNEKMQPDSPENPFNIEASKKIFPGQYTLEDFAKNDEGFKAFVA
ncbi:NAD(P)-binding protein [Exidia glandulosa HHB12029]|uniref:NAD(P)-binding protein n=1 Tax=Exidia glandulosa HHB12029 TaxID=1314781 RepID=A0A165IJJ3_EXIGL|nr:NAD(P)-binding protein [Exidia glandulosa HHB12029]